MLSHGPLVRCEPPPDAGPVTQTTERLQTPGQHEKPSRARKRRPHRAWLVAAVTFMTITMAAGFASLPGLLVDPLHEEFGWSRGTIGFAVSVNLALYGLTAPFAAALMDRFGVRRVVAAALTVIAFGGGLTVFMTSPWQLILCWGVL